MTKVETVNLPESKLTKSQKRQFGPRPIAGYGADATMTVEIRYDDDCGNSHNTFAITAKAELLRLAPEGKAYVKTAEEAIAKAEGRAS